jgi:hypothetical protein
MMTVHLSHSHRAQIEAIVLEGNQVTKPPWAVFAGLGDAPTHVSNTIESAIHLLVHVLEVNAS